MNTPWNVKVWHQYGAAIDDLDNTIRDCPDDLWRARLWNNSPEEARFFLPEFWYVVYHALFWVDLYLTGTEEGFVPPSPFLLVEQHENGPLPERPYTKEQLRDYLAGCRQRCQTMLEAMTDETAKQRCEFSWGTVSFGELQLYSLRHLAGHAAQLNMALGQHTAGAAPDWVPTAREQS